MFADDYNVNILAKAEPWNGDGQFTWSILINNRGFDIRKKILPLLLKMTNKHCAFCDYFPLSVDVLNPIPIEHFYPKCKDKFPEKAYEWGNLFPSCNGCTSNKKDKFDEKLLKPDNDEYNFDNYFDVTGDGKLIPSKTADETSKKKAQITIEIYKLNKRGDLLSLRKQASRDYPKLLPIFDKDERPFRFLIPIAEKAKNTDAIINSFIQ